MRLLWSMIISHFLSALAAAGAIALAMAWGGGFALGLACIVTLGACGWIAWWTGARLRRQLSLLERAMTSGELEQCQASGVREIEHIAQELRTRARRDADTVVRVRQQIHEVESLLAQMQSRPHSEVASRTDLSTVRQLRQLLASVAKVTGVDLQQVLECTEEIARRTQEMADGAEEQAKAVSQTTTCVEQMSSNIDSVSRNADAANEAAVAARESAAAGLELVRGLIRGMDRIRVQMEAGGKKLRTLGDRSQEIGSIVETICTISARTDMLALNASIESARAGENGRGFAVVAEEVRKLAEQTAQAAREVSGLIESIQMETQESIAVMADEREQVETEVRRVNEAGVALERISQTSSESAQRVGEISLATLHQIKVAQEVVLAMQRISEIARGIRGRAVGVCGTTRTMTKLAHQLRGSLTPLHRCSETHLELDRVAAPIVVSGQRSSDTTTHDWEPEVYPTKHPTVPVEESLVLAGHRGD